MTFTQIVENKKLELRKINIQQVRNEISADWVRNKIVNFIKRYDGAFTQEEVKKRILEDDIVASFFAKDPAKQSISEKLAEEMLGIPKLQSFGKDSIRFTPDGSITHTNGIGNTKSADFRIGKYYITQKYTREDGGTQDDQYNDVVDFLTKGSINNKVGALVDGDYWINKKNQLKQGFINNSNVKIFSIDEILSGEGSFD